MTSWIYVLSALLLAVAAGCSADSEHMHNGYYSARSASFNSDGWQECITLYVYNNSIATVEYNALNASGLILSWDVRSMRKLKEKIRVHPNQVIREYTRELINRQNPESIRKVYGDTYFYEAFTKLAAAAITQAKTGNKAVVKLRLTEAGTTGR